MTREVTLIYGRTGAGKTVLARAVLAAQLRRGAVGVVIDTLREYDELALVELSDLPEFLRRARPGACCRVWCDDDNDLMAVWSASTAARRPLCWLVEEVSYWSRPNWLSPGLANAVRYGRHYQISLICVARRPAETARELSAQATRICIFRCVEWIDLRYWSASLPPGAAARLPKLPPYHYLDYRVMSGLVEVRKSGLSD